MPHVVLCSQILLRTWANTSDSLQLWIHILTDGDGGGGGLFVASIFAIIYTHHSWHLFALERCVGILYWNILTSKTSKSRPYFYRNMDVFFYFWDPEWGEGAAPAPPSGSATALEEFYQDICELLFSYAIYCNSKQ